MTCSPRLRCWGGWRWRRESRACHDASADAAGPELPRRRLPRPGGDVRSRYSGSLAHLRRPGDNAGGARDDGGDRLLRGLVFISLLNGIRPFGILEWVSPVAPVVTDAAVGAGHWAAGRRQRALAAWASAAGFGLVAWGLGTEAPSRAEWQRYIEQQKDLMRKRGMKMPVTAARTETSAARRRFSNALDVLGPSIKMFFGVRYGLRRLTVLAIADEAWYVVFYGLRVPWALERRKPRISIGSALVVAGSVARLRAQWAEPLRNGRPAVATATREHRENR
jgi:hypothetical protein